MAGPRRSARSTSRARQLADPPASPSSSTLTSLQVPEIPGGDPGLGIGSSRASVPSTQLSRSRSAPQRHSEASEAATDLPESPRSQRQYRGARSLRPPSSPGLSSEGSGLSPGPRSLRSVAPSGSPSSALPATPNRPLTASSEGSSRSPSGQKRKRGGVEERVSSRAESSAMGARRSVSEQHLRSFSGSQDPLQSGRASSRSRPSEEDLAGRRYALRIIQQPLAGSAFGSNLLSRLAIAPPLVVQLVVTDERGREIPAHEEMPFLVCHVSLITESGQSADLLSPASSPTRAEEQTSASGSTSEVSGSSSRRGGSSRRRGAATSLSPVQPPRGAESLQSAGPLRMLYGTLVASPQHFQDIEGQMRTFFLYPEISVRAVGRFQIRVVLMRIPRPGMSPTSSSLASATTEPFNVVLPAEYVAPHITDITRHVARQGAGLLLPPGQHAD